MNPHLTPVIDPDTGETTLYDMWVDGKWVGSRRTAAQCVEQLRTRHIVLVTIPDSYRIENGLDGHRIVFNDP